VTVLTLVLGALVLVLLFCLSIATKDARQAQIETEMERYERTTAERLAGIRTEERDDAEAKLLAKLAELTSLRARVDYLIDEGAKLQKANGRMAGVAKNSVAKLKENLQARRPRTWKVLAQEVVDELDRGEK
jgi:hypothetical protein